VVLQSFDFTEQLLTERHLRRNRVVLAQCSRKLLFAERAVEATVVSA
jgi:hypothetical protein